MKCHYEVLEAAKDADADTLKKQYRKMALKYHPDKNPDDPEGAKQTFQIIQQAYDVLSDPQERAWYDSHRDQILRGGLGEKLEEDGIDLFQYFSSSCYSGFGDDESGFYGVYNEVFNILAKEDMDFIDDEDSDFEIPGFGKSVDDYETVVGPFYAYWTSYNTPRSYTWLDKYDTRQGENRWVKRKMEAENKKVRDKAKKERNEVVRNLIQFVRKRDKRVVEYGKKLQEKAELNKKKTLEFQKKQREERRKLFDATGEAGGFDMTEMEKQLKQLEGEYTDSECSDDDESLLSDEELGEELDNLYCVACDKIFRTVGAKDNHETSKKHKDNLEKLIAEMNEDEDCGQDDKRQELSEEEVEDQGVKISNNSGLETQSKGKSKKQRKKQKKKFQEERLNSDSEHVEQDDVKPTDDDRECESKDLSEEEGFGVGETQSNAKSKKKKKKQKKLQNVTSLSDSEHVEKDVLEFPNSNLEDDFDSRKKRKNKRKNRREKSEACDNLEINEHNDNKDIDKENSVTVEEHEENVTGNNMEEEITIIKASANEKDEESNPRISKKVKQENIKNKGEDVSKSENLCVQCKAAFPSKNKLFNHLKSSGHAVYIPTETKPIVSNKSKKKNKK